MRGIPRTPRGCPGLDFRNGSTFINNVVPKTEAKAFQRWVTSEVLPSIRKSGRYTVSPQIANNRVELEIIGIDERIKSSTRRCIEEGILPMQRCGLAIDDRDQMRATDCLNQITSGAIQTCANEDEFCTRGFFYLKMHAQLHS